MKRPADQKSGAVRSFPILEWEVEATFCSGDPLRTWGKT